MTVPFTSRIRPGMMGKRTLSFVRNLLRELNSRKWWVQRTRRCRDWRSYRPICYIARRSSKIRDDNSARFLISTKLHRNGISHPDVAIRQTRRRIDVATTLRPGHESMGMPPLHIRVHVGYSSQKKPRRSWQTPEKSHQ